MAGYFEIACGIAVLIILLYYYLVPSYDFWKVRGVPGPKPIPIFGNIAPLLREKYSPGDFMKMIYDAYPDAPMVGLYSRTKPILLLRDPDFIKDVLIRDFSKFAGRGLPIMDRAEPLSQHLLALDPKRWRPLRSKFSPAFTSGKLKDMFNMILECADNFEKHLEKIAAKGEPIEIRDLTAKFMTDVIGSCAFGIDTQAVGDKESRFREMGRQIFEPVGFGKVRLRLRQFAPSFYNFMGYFLPNSEMTKFFVSLITDTMKYRRQHNIVRNDFVNILQELQDHPEKLGDIELTESLIAAQAFVFFTAGFETSSTTMSNALYELAMHHDIQDKLREEIRTTYKKNNGDLQYETIKEMKYLDSVFRETLRKYPPGTFLSRQSTESYTFEGTKVTVPADQVVWIPVYAIHTDPTIYPDPDKFDINRFSEEAVAARHPMNYLPFGDGPRNCIGARFAVYQTKIGLVRMLHHYKVDICDHTPIPYEHDTKNFLLLPKGGIDLLITKADDS